MVKRFDTHTIGDTQKTPQGGLRIPAALTRVGVFDYRRADGSVVRELRRPEEVFHQDSLASLRGCTVTEGHPDEMVNPSNFRALAVGHVGDNVRADDSNSHVLSDVVVNEGRAVQRIDSRELREISCGYTLTIKEGGGVWNGQRYDQEQTNIWYNHVGLGPEGWGRQGSSVSLRLDSGDAVQVAADPQTQPKTQEQEPMATMIRIDNVECEQGGATHISLLTKQTDAERARADKAEAELATEKTRADKAEGELAAEKTAHDKTKGALEAAQDPARMDAAVKQRATLLADATKLIPEDKRKDAKLEGSDTDVRKAALLAHGVPAERLDGKSDDFVCGVFEHTLTTLPADAGATQRNDSLAALAQASHPAQAAPQQHMDAREAFMAESRSAWKNPLTHNNHPGQS